MELLKKVARGFHLNVQGESFNDEEHKQKYIQRLKEQGIVCIYTVDEGYAIEVIGACNTKIENYDTCEVIYLSKTHGNIVLATYKDEEEEKQAYKHRKVIMVSTINDTYIDDFKLDEVCMYSIPHAPFELYDETETHKVCVGAVCYLKDLIWWE